MATLATPPFVQPVNRLIGLLPPLGKQSGPPPRVQSAPKLLETGVTEPGLGKGMLAWLPVVPLALLAVPLWPLLFVALVLLLLGLTPFVLGLKLLATLRRGLRPAR
jgi:hypothetical protein